MTEYAGYVGSCYVITVVLLGWNIVSVFFEHRRRLHEIRLMIIGDRH